MAYLRSMLKDRKLLLLLLCLLLLWKSRAATLGRTCRQIGQDLNKQQMLQLA